MPKRKDFEDKLKKKQRRFEGEEESSSDEDDDMLNVDFEFFSPQPEWDFHGLKVLLRQLFDADAQLLDLSALADLILSQPTLGSTVKVESNETDPYAFLSVINLKEHKKNPAVGTLIDYLLRQAGRNASLAPVSDLLKSGDAEIGLVLTERLINMPAEIAPPMYKMLQEEIDWAIEDKEPYNFTHYLVLSKTYREVQSKLGESSERPKKKQRGGDENPGDAFYFHPEDPVLQNHAVAFGGCPFLHEATDEEADSKRAFHELGIKPQGHLILIESAKFVPALEALQNAFPAPAS